MGYDGGRSGLSTYINESIRELVKDHRVDLLILKSDCSAFPVNNKNLNFIIIPDYMRKPLLNMFWHLFILPFKLNLKKYDFCFLPVGNRRLLSRCPVPSITTFHDLSQLYIKDKYDKKRIFYIKKIIPRYLKKIDFIFTPSENTKKDIIKFYKMSGENISVNHLGYDLDRFYPMPDGETRSYSRLKEKKNYLLYVSRLEFPGKNHVKLIEAYEKLPADLKNKYNLVFAGQKWNGSEKIEERIAVSPDKDKIFITGFVPHECLPELYKEASLFVFPSLYEGFGFPLLESMACGVPAICSNCSSLPEIGGSAVKTFDPENSIEISRKIQEVLNDEKLYKEMKEKSLLRAEKFRWSKHTEKIISQFEKLKNE